jgi:hypothetical protein
MTNSTFLPEPLPRASQILDGVAGYNPLLECPCSDRPVKEWDMTYSIDPSAWDGEAGQFVLFLLLHLCRGK